MHEQTNEAGRFLSQDYNCENQFNNTVVNNLENPFNTPVNGKGDQLFQQLYNQIGEDEE